MIVLFISVVLITIALVVASFIAIGNDDNDDKQRVIVTSTSTSTSTSSSTSTTTTTTPSTLDYNPPADPSIVVLPPTTPTTQPSKNVYWLEATSDTRFEPEDCLDDARTLVSCDVPHAFEVFGFMTFAHGPGVPYPATQLRELAQTECVKKFESFVGRPYATSMFELFIEVPSEATWNAGDRRANCELADLGMGLPPGSQRGSMR